MIEARVTTHASCSLNPGGLRHDTQEQAVFKARGTPPLDPRGVRNHTQEHAQ